MSRLNTPRPQRGSNGPVVERVPLTSLSLDEANPVRHTDEDVKRAQPFIRRYAERALPIVVGPSGRVLIGHVFVEAARREKVEQVWVIRQDLLGDTEEQLYSIAGTRLLQTGHWDIDTLDAAVRAFEQQIEDFSPALLGFAPGELDRVLGLGTVSGDADAVPELGQRPVSSIGTIWLLGHHRVMCGDATSRETVAELMDGKEAAVAPIDAPFGERVNGFYSTPGLHREFVEGSGDKTEAELGDFFQRAFEALFTALRPGAIVFAFIDWRGMPTMLGAGQIVFGKLLNLCVWAKNRAGMGSFYRSQHELVLVFSKPGASHVNNIRLGKHGRNRSNLWSFPAAASLRKGREGDMLKSHPTPKTVEMIVEAILDCSARGDVVIDTFLGSGTTLVAAERSSRICCGMDLDPLYVDLAVRRWQNWTGKKAVHSVTGVTFDDMALAIENEGGDHV